MLIQVLGPVSISADGRELSLGGRQQRLVLALLVSAEGRSVSSGQLIDGVWGEEVTPTARKALQGYIHHLRAEIGTALKTSSGGYSLDTNGDVDAVQFAGMHSEAARSVEADPARASELLRDALGLWTGPAYADLRDELALKPEVVRLENLRIAALGDRIEADLALGRHDGLIGELEGLTHEYPLQERFCGQRMTALYRAGRQVEALRSYERTRRLLVDEAGLEPSSALQHLEERILAQDESLLVAGNDVSAGRLTGPTGVRGYELRERIAAGEADETYRAYQRSVGRQVVVRILGPEIANDPDFIADFLTDTGRIAAIEHPNISYVFDTWREPGRAYQVSRWLGGGNLVEVMAAKPLGLGAALSMLDQIGGALAHAHRQGVVHGRVGPSKVMFDDSGHAYLGDFTLGAKPASGREKDRQDFVALAHLVIAGRPPVGTDGLMRADLANSPVPTGVASVFDLALGPNGYERVEDFLRALRQASGADVVPMAPAVAPQVDVRNPYKGLQAFQESDSDDFYGRDDLVEQLAAGLQRSRLLSVVGPSGSGKSSVVKAGLISLLKSKSESAVLVTEMYPGAFPFEELETALLRIGVNRADLIGDLVGDDRGLLRVVKQILPSDDSELVLVIDQFEELFSIVADEETRQLFLDSLATAVTDPRSRLRVVLTMRADFFDRPLEYPRFGELMKRGLVPVTLPSDEELARAVSQPAASVGVEFEPGLVAQIVQDISGQPGGLPLMQYALTEFFDNRETSMLTFSGYRRNGSIVGALGRRAEELYQDLSPVFQQAMRHALLHMVTIEDGADDLRRRVRRSELNAPGVDEGALTEALQALGAARLVTFDRDPVTRSSTVEVAHEALLREWSRLAGWIEDQRDDLVLRRRLDTAVAEWQQADQSESYLLSGGRLAQFRAWADETNLALNRTERAYLQDGADREASRIRRTNRARRIITLGLTTLAAVSVTLAAIALDARSDAQTEAAVAVDARNDAQTQAAIAQQETGRALASADQMFDFLSQLNNSDRPVGQDFKTGDLRPSDVPVGAVPESPRLDFLTESCIDEFGSVLGRTLQLAEGSCNRDALFIHPQLPLQSGPWLAFEPFHIRHGFVNTDDAPIEFPDYDLQVFITRVSGPPLRGQLEELAWCCLPGRTETFEIGQPYKLYPDYIVRTIDRCGPDYKNQTEPMPCDQFVHEFPNGLPPGRYSFWVEWHAPCVSWPAVAESCAAPTDLVNLFTSSVNSPFLYDSPFLDESYTPTQDGNAEIPWPYDPWEESAKDPPFAAGRSD